MSYFYIDREECIGDSLNKINANADNFDTRLDSISSTFVKQVVSVSPQIIPTTTNGVTTLSAIPSYKALVTFRGKGVSSLSACTIYDSYKVTEVTKLREAYYRVKFSEPVLVTGFTHACIIEQDTDATTIFGTNSFDTLGTNALNWTGLTPVTAVDIFSVNTGLPPSFTSYKDTARATLVFY